MPDLNLRPVDQTSSSSASRSRPVPTRSLLKPWDFDYAPASSGLDLNLLIMFHGMGDTKTSFFNLAKSLNLPHTAVLSLQAPEPVPLMDLPSYMWYNAFDAFFNPLPSPDPTKPIPGLRQLLATLTSPEVGWDLTQIHLFGWGQGGTMALELAYAIGRSPLPDAGAGASSAADTLPSVSPGSAGRRRLGSVVSVCAGLLSHPTKDERLPTPTLIFTRGDSASAVGQKMLGSARRAFRDVEVVSAKGRGEDMPRGADEWRGIMRFWGQVLGRDEGWKGQGEVYEVVR